MRFLGLRNGSLESGEPDRRFSLGFIPSLNLRFDKMGDPFAPRSMKRKNVKGLALTPAAPKPPPTAETNRFDSDGGRDDGHKDGQLEIGIEYKLDLQPEDLENLRELGSGNGGSVSKVKHLTTGTVMARKVS